MHIYYLLPSHSAITGRYIRALATIFIVSCTRQHFVRLRCIDPKPGMPAGKKPDLEHNCFNYITV